MKHFVLTFFSGIVFFATAFLGGSLDLSSADVSRRTDPVGHHGETMSVKQGVSQDGLFVITKVSTAPSIPPRIKSANHERTLRAFIAPDHSGVSTLYLERAKPHEYYALLGGFTLAEEYPILAWTSMTTLIFYGRAFDGGLMRYAADVHLLTLSQSPIDVPPLSATTITADRILP